MPPRLIRIGKSAAAARGAESTNFVSRLSAHAPVEQVVALGAGFMEGIGLGDNSKAAVIRLGLLEMRRFIQAPPPLPAPTAAALPGSLQALEDHGDGPCRWTTRTLLAGGCLDPYEGRLCRHQAGQTGSNQIPPPEDSD